ncbi:MAG: metallophosphoesterase [Nanoarchaeota archaeon]|nr:metallophosphoesterase [Nanoarchaeota archaeon]
MSENILKLFIKKGFLLDKDMLDFFSQLEDEDVANEILSKIQASSGEKLITRSLINSNMEKIKPVFKELDNEKQKLVERFFVNISVSVEVKKETRIENIEDDKKINEDKKKLVKTAKIKVLSSPIVQDQRLEVKDFVRHFRNRYNFFKKILQDKTELEGLTSIDKISGSRTFSIIAMITNKSVTKNKNVILEVEDLTGKTKLLVTKTKEEIFEKAKEIVLDDVIAFKCSGSRDFLFVNDLFYPDSFLSEKKKLDEEVYALFISDMHIGSANFLEESFSKFIGWLNGEGCDEEQKEMLKKIKYLFVVGDSIEGVGIYPGQEKFLVIKDIRDQYKKLTEFYKKIPKHISIIQCAGQHDAVRVAEPQPPIGEDFAESLTKVENLYLVSNPSLIEIEGGEKEGFKVLMYHGASMHGLINEIEELRLSNAHHTPAKAVKHLLKRRHLAPIHGSAIYIPNPTEDSMVIRQVPDIVATGDLHKVDVEIYNNILIVCSSCWQSITPFEEKMGNQPDYCKVPILNLKTREIKILDFE